MFNKKKKVVAEPAQEFAGDELIIHNMPSPTKMTGGGSDPAFSAGFRTDGQVAGKTASNFKMTGLLIMAGGVIIIGVLAYLSYRFIIKPAAEPMQPSEVLISPIAETEEDITAGVVVPASDPIPATDLSESEPLEIETTGSSEQTEATTTSVIVEEAVLTLPDSDDDGLSDPEEAVFGTDPLLADSDGDSYPDALELAGGFNPLGDGATSEVILARHQNDTFGYELVYPAAWAKQSLNVEATVIFTTSDESLIQIIASANEEKASILAWYNEAFPGTEVSYGNLQAGDGWEGIMSEDGLNFYLTDASRGRILVLSYISASGHPSYPFIFKMMIDSLSIR